LASWLAEETLCSLYEAASPMLLPGVTSRAVEYLSLDRPLAPCDAADLTRAQAALVELLESEGEVTLERAQRALGSSLATIVPALESRGLVRRIARVRHRPPEPRRPSFQVRLLPDAEPPPESAPRQREAFTWLYQRLRASPERALPIERVLNVSGIDRAVLRALERRGCIAIEEITETDEPDTSIGGDVTL